jgi:DNA-directed RNA polymerase specialized sigma24 family protein
MRTNAKNARQKLRIDRIRRIRRERVKALTRRTLALIDAYERGVCARASEVPDMARRTVQLVEAIGRPPELMSSGVVRVVDHYVGRYTRKFPHVGTDECRQAAWVAVCAARRTWRADGGASFETYVQRILVRELWRHAVRAWAPVHFAKPRLAEALHSRAISPDEVTPAMARLAVCVDRDLISGTGSSSSDGETRSFEAGTSAPDMASAIDTARVYRRLRSVIEQSGGGVALQALLGERRYSEVGAEFDVSVGEVRAAARRARAAVKQDGALKIAAKELFA